MFSFFSSEPPKVTEKMLIDAKIPLIHKEEISIEKKLICVTGSGKFYKGTYNNTPVSVKAVDIIKDDTITTEFIYWNAYKNNDKILKLYGVYLTNKIGYIILEDFVITMEDALKNNKNVSFPNKLSLASQTFDILYIFQKENKKILDFRPKVLGLTQNGCLKLLDFGKLINPEKLLNYKEILKEKIKYEPPESINNTNNVDDISYDIWSYGCILLDIFAEESKICNYNINNIDNFKNLVINGQFPDYSKENFHPILKNLLMKCLDRNVEKRVKYRELDSEIKSFVEHFLSNDVDITKISVDDNKNISERLGPYHFFVVNNEPKINFKLNDINNNLLEKSSVCQKSINEIFETEKKTFNSNIDIMIKTLKEDAILKQKIILKIKEELSSQIGELKQLLIFAIGDITTSQKIILDMKKNIMFLFASNDFLNENEDPVFLKLEEEKSKIMQLLIKYSKDELFDRITLHFDKAKKLIDFYKELCTQKETLMTEIMELIVNHKKKYIDSNELKIFLPKLGINVRDLGDEYIGNNVKDYYKEFICKPYDNSNVINVFDLFNKQYFQYTLDSIYVFSNSFSFYDIKKKKLYITGGYNNEENTGIDIAYEISFDNYNKFDNNVHELDVKVKEITRMKFTHFSHSMIKFEDNYLIVAGGDNVECEIYDIENNIWSNLPQLPFICNNSILSVFQRTIFLFNDDKILRINIINLTKNEKKEIINVQENNWEVVEFIFNVQLENENNQFLFRNKMGSYCDYNNGTIYLFGGNDGQNNHNQIYKMELLDSFEVPDEKNKHAKKIKKVLKKNFLVEVDKKELNFSSSFNNNIISLQNNYLLMIDNKNNAIEFNLMNRECFIYDK